MFKRFRIAILLYVLVFVVVGQFLAESRSTDWNDRLWVNVYPVDGNDSAATRAYIDSLDESDFDEIERFLAAEAERYGIGLDAPFHIHLANRLDRSLPQLADDAGFAATMLWSLRMRWFVVRLHLGSDEPTPDISVFAVYRDGSAGNAIDRSTALRKGLIVVANLFATKTARGSNQVILAHELLHTLGATDKYDLASNQPHYPLGYAEPERAPLYPQSQAELMAGRIPLDADEAVIPKSLHEVVIGPVSAAEIGWGKIRAD